MADCAPTFPRPKRRRSCREEHCLHELVRRLQRFEDFPHEIGLFLSYPPEDVRGFIEHKGKESKCDGCWKVYGDENRARAVPHLQGVYRQLLQTKCRGSSRGRACRDGINFNIWRNIIMSKLAVVYWSGTGNTEAMANAVAEGARTAGATAEAFTVGDFSADQVEGYDALA